MREWEIDFLRRLRDSGDNGIVQSGIPKRCHTIVDALRACGAADYLPSASGRGITLGIKSEASFATFVESRCPSGLDFEFDAIQSHSEAIAHLGDAKAFRQSIAEGIFVRSTKPNIAIRCKQSGNTIPVSELTAVTGCAAIQLAESRSWSFTGSIAIIENADAFWLYERVIPQVDLAVFASGRMSGRLLDWLASPELADSSIIHWGDYDPVGVAEYVRLLSRCGDRATTFVPNILDSLIKRFGKRKLVTDQADILSRLRNHTPDPHVARMIDLFDQHRRGLEQEIMLLNGINGIPE